MPSTSTCLRVSSKQTPEVHNVFPFYTQGDGELKESGHLPKLTEPVGGHSWHSLPGPPVLNPDSPPLHCAASWHLWGRCSSLSALPWKPPAEEWAQGSDLPSWALSPETLNLRQNDTPKNSWCRHIQETSNSPGDCPSVPAA